MGASFAGLCAAAALADNFDRVTILERDRAPVRPVARKGTPQVNHVHILLARGQDVVARLFPGVFEALEADGARQSDFGERVRWFHHGSWRVKGQVNVPGWFQRRPLLDWHLRENLASTRANVEWRYETAVETPLHDNGRVRGVRLVGGEELQADLVVDTTGRGSRSRKWLQEWGYPEVEEQRVNVSVAYVSGEFELGPNAQLESGLAIYQRPPHNCHAAFATRVSDKRALVTLIDYNGEQAPLDASGFVEWSKTLARPELYQLLRGARLHGPLRRHIHPFQRRFMYGSKRMPRDYLIMGDAMCCVDPTFGQGMTVSAMEADALSRYRPGQNTRALQRRLLRTTDIAWLMTATEALRWPIDTGWKPFGAKFLLNYFARLFDLASYDLHSYSVLLQVMHFRRKPIALFNPRTLWKAMFGRPPKPVAGVPQLRTAAPSASMEMAIQTGEFSISQPPSGP